MRVAWFTVGRMGILCLGLIGGSLRTTAAVASPAAGGDRISSARVPADGSAGDAVQRHHGLWQRSHPLLIQHGILTVDGLAVKTGLSFRVANLRYMYVYVPGSGTVLIAERPFEGAREERAAFRGRTLTVTAGGSRVQLTTANRMRSTRSAFVRFERGMVAGADVPMLGFGEAAMVPAVWAPDGGAPWRGRHRARVRHAHFLRSARLCRPSPHGGEKCAVIREVAWNH